MVNNFVDVIPYCNRETLRKCKRYMKKHKCSFVEAYNSLYNTHYKYTYEDKLKTMDLNSEQF